MSHDTAADVDESHLRRALALAREAADAGDEPFGSLLVRDGEIVAESCNTIHTDDDVTAHPELKLARWAARELDAGELAETTMYTSTEPCPMCAGAMYHAGLRRVVFSTSAETVGEIAGAGLVMPSSEVFARGAESVETVGPVLESEGRAVHESFW
ncbi:tRNA(Arg) A34 adenosine deaminase TadA [Halogranum gelatinilyticum]|uniref:tRNA(Arg) A34 adenosine deaminase TadA n=1 Tax=Halogranum gelatinilyticum TaxID=660521 RepID=A0A1G9QDH4_9EURY|nr:nucleoside deaminase [Halogranum gelatinilyticum]SDM09036.1 tRNA(Arg) A34 adenosine deaminase TadA [Halogranum gelatinilyticum]